jgi:ketosteroid isomerase-like protein
VTPRDQLSSLYRAFNARDIDTVLAALHPDVDWPNGMDAGRVRGHRAVRDYWTRQWSIIDPTVDPVGFDIEDDGRIAVDVHQVVRDRGGAVLADQPVQHVYELRDGLITRMEIRKPYTLDRDRARRPHL